LEKIRTPRGEVGTFGMNPFITVSLCVNSIRKGNHAARTTGAQWGNFFATMMPVTLNYLMEPAKNAQLIVTSAFKRDLLHQSKVERIA
jgi:hypothetical protein